MPPSLARAVGSLPAPSRTGSQRPSVHHPSAPILLRPPPPPLVARPFVFRPHPSAVTRPALFAPAHLEARIPGRRVVPMSVAGRLGAVPAGLSSRIGTIGRR
ncbi:MAG TPA: hypothetical protein VFO55_09660 [Gemmatimonadaceae bacterium]|nr:hypothetical protein [Gemmatimonadaceae bacterium]